MPAGRMKLGYLFLVIVTDLTQVLTIVPDLTTETWIQMIFLPYDIQPGSVIYQLEGRDNDPIPDYPLSFTIIGSGRDTVEAVSISETRANLILKRSLDKGKMYFLKLELKDTREEAREYDIRLNVTEASVLDDRFVKYRRDPILVPEDTSVGNTITTIKVRKDVKIDRWPNLILNNEKSTFRLDPLGYSPDGIEVRLVLIKKLDFEKRNYYALNVTVLMNIPNHYPDNRNFKVITIFIDVGDVQDTEPIFTKLPHLTKIRSDIPQGKVILSVAAKDGDGTPIHPIHYSLQGPNERLFKIDSRTGDISTAQPGHQILPGCADTAKLLQVKAEEESFSRASTVKEIVIFIEASKKSQPKFSSENYKASVDENTTIRNSLVFQEPIRLEDESNCNILKVAIQDGEASDVFGVNPSLLVHSAELEIFVKKPEMLDYEKQKTTSFLITAYPEQATENSVTSTATVTVTIRDVNDNFPKFTSDVYKVNILESAGADTRVVQVTATDVDEGNNGAIRYTKIMEGSKISDKFNINPKTGEITVARSDQLDREKKDRYLLKVEACDEDGRGKCTSVMVDVTITDVNDEKPTFVQPNYVVCLTNEMRSGQDIARLSAVDKDLPGDKNSEIRYAIISGNLNSYFRLDRAGTLFLTEDVTSMENKDATLVVKASDGGNPSQSSETTVSISSDPQKCRPKIVEYVIAKSESDVQKNKEKIARILLHLNSGSYTNLIDFRPSPDSTPAKPRTILVTSVVQQQNSSVDLTVLDKTMLDIEFNGSDSVERIAETATVESEVWKWVLVSLLIILAIVLLILFCCCLCKPNSKYSKTTQVYNKNKGLHTADIVSHHTTGHHHRHHRHRRHNERIVSAPIANGKTNIPYSRHLQDDVTPNSDSTREQNQQNSATKIRQVSALNVETASDKILNPTTIITETIQQENIVVPEESIPANGDDNRPRTQLKNQFLEKKSLFTIAYDGMHSRHDLLKDQDYPASNTPIS